jgi:hypothetical protein
MSNGIGSVAIVAPSHAVRSYPPAKVMKQDTTSNSILTLIAGKMKRDLSLVFTGTLFRIFGNDYSI